jgi:hypothetical protein
MLTSDFPNLIHDVNVARIAPVAAARFVLTKIMVSYQNLRKIFNKKNPLPNYLVYVYQVAS